MQRRVIVLLILSSMMASCVSLNSYRDLEKRNTELENRYEELNRKGSTCNAESAELREKNERLTAELTQIRKSAKMLYEKAMASYEANKYYAAREQFEKLTDRYPADLFATAAWDKLAEMNAMATANYQKLTKSLDGLKEPKARIDLLDKETSEKYFSETDLEKLMRKRESYLVDLRMQDEATKHILIEDDSTQSTRYYRTTRSVIQQIDRNKSFYVELYIAQHYSGKKVLRLKTQYVGNKWISFDTVSLKGEGVQLEFVCKYPDKMSKMTSDHILEWSDNEVDDDEKMLRLARAEVITVRIGGGYKYTFVLDDEQVTSFKEIARKYQALK